MKDRSSTNKTATITVKIDSDLKDSVESILNRLGLNHSSVIQVLYNQIELTNSLPFSVSIPDKPIKKKKV
jgi:DNA-damage-inducible protein J